MKNTLFIISMVTSLVLSGISSAATNDKSSGKDIFQPVQPEELFVFLENSVDKETVEALLQKLKDPDPFVRVEAVQSLGEIQIEQSLESLCGCLKDENLYVRAYAAEAVGKIGRVDISLAILCLLTGLDDSSPYVRAMLVSALGELQDERAVVSLRKYLSDEDKSVRDMAAWALENIEKAQ
jgi:HEAT repeat protein